MSDHHDGIVLGGGGGGGPAGYATAFRAAELGKNVALIEEGRLDGTCLHRGCILINAPLHSAEITATICTSPKCGIHATFDRVDATVVQQYKNATLMNTSVPLRRGSMQRVALVSGIALTHTECQHDSAVAETICGHPVAMTAESGYPRTVYSSPQVASIGLAETQSRAACANIDVVTYDLAGNVETQIARGGGGVTVIRDQASGKVIGIHRALYPTRTPRLGKPLVKRTSLSPANPCTDTHEHRRRSGRGPDKEIHVARECVPAKRAMIVQKYYGTA